MHSTSPVLILGAGINGAALARELVLNGVSVVVVDHRDLAAGTTAYSSRLIHGGLRYLEYGDFELVRESLAERTRWLRLAPHLVKPLRLFIPVENRWGGFGGAVRNFLGIRQRAGQQPTSKKRGLSTIRAGLWLYDRYARDKSLPRHRSYRLPNQALPPVDPHKYRWGCAYYDAQICFPERFTLELLKDARDAARHVGIEFQLFTYHRAIGRHDQFDIVPLEKTAPSVSIAPAAIVNATGAWVDVTLSELGLPSKKLLGGTKGSHFVTFHRELAELLGGNGVYAEAADGRPVFILPFGDSVLVGTTDEPFEGDPETARATTAEIRYLMNAVHTVFPQVLLKEVDIELVYSGVRPLPMSGPAVPAAITRRHWLEEHESANCPCYSIVGGKLTTCRSLAERAAQTILARLGLPQRASSRDRPLPGEGMFPTTPHATPNQAQTLLDHTPYPVALVRYMVEHEWVRRLEDFVERRLMLLYHRPLTRRCLEQLADVLVESNLLDKRKRDAEIETTVQRLHERFSKRVV
jgi:glycerol-3-phosphate dehydrogenase